MKKKKADRSPPEELRRQAEETMKLEKPLPEEIPPAEVQRVIHELRVHQIELEMQNDELRQTQEILEESRSRYSDLYNFAPVGYLTLDERGVIKEANLTATRLLQVERKWLIDRPFTHFMVIEDREAFRRHLNLVLQGQEGHTVEVRLKGKDEQAFFTLLESACHQNATGKSLCRTAFSDISQRRQAEADLRESEARYRSLFQDNHAVMLLIDPATGDIVDANPAACAFYGFSREELTARKITDINTLSPEQVFAEMRLAKKDKRRQFHFRHRLARGEVRDVEVFSGPLRLQGQDLLYSIVHDITARRLAEEALQRQQEELQIILDSVPALIFYKDKENRFIRTNRALEVALGLPKEELDGKSLFDLFPSQAEDYYKDDLEVINSSSPKRNIVETLETTAGVRWFRTDKIPYRDNQGNIIGVIGFSIDITERKWAEESLQASHRFLEIANRHQRMAPLLEAFVTEIKNLTGCEAVGIRILQGNGGIPYDAYTGFSQEFYNLENPLCIWVDQCMCINIIKGEADPKFSYYTPGGSFHINRLDEFFCKLSSEEQKTLRGNCQKFGYESMALVPIRLGDQVLGLIHAADSRKDLMPMAMVDLLEKVGLQMGMAIQRAKAEEALQRAHDELEQRVEERTAELRKQADLLDLAHDAIIVWDLDSRVVFWSRGAEETYGWTKVQAMGQQIHALLNPQFPMPLAEIAREAIESGRWEGESQHTKADGAAIVVASRLALQRDDQGRPAAIMEINRDITERKRAENILHARLKLVEFAESYPQEEFPQAALDELESLTGSTIGFYHLVDADQKTLSLQSWSTNTLKNMCTAEGKGRHYDIAEAGVWADCVTQRRPVIHNNYAALPHRKGSPPGHAPVVRELVVPILRGDKVVAIIGVGNKPADYDEHDVELVSLLGDFWWDIAERKRAEEAVAQHAALVQDLYNNAPCGYHSLDQDGAFVQINDTELAWLGYTREEVLGRKFFDFITAGSLKVYQKNFPELKKRGWVKDLGYEMVRKDGTVMPVSLSATAVRDEAGQYLMSRSTLFDITERQRAETEIRKLNEELEQRVQERTAELEAINQELDAFSFSVSHDLKAPLRTIKGFSRMLLAEHSSRLDADGLRMLNVVYDNTSNMGQLIDDLLALSRLGRQQIRKSAINLTAMTNQVFQRLRSQEPERNLQLAIGDLPEAFGDPNLIKQVMINLLGNAVKYSKCRKTAAIEVGGWSEGDENIYFVKDNGSGFDPRYADRLFVAFQRLHSSLEFEGTGVGLAIVQRIIHRHGGRVWAEGIVDEGAAFYFTLPKNKD
jgi:PAS domain S-box-containing protein